MASSVDVVPSIQEHSTQQEADRAHIEEGDRPMEEPRHCCMLECMDRGVEDAQEAASTAAACSSRHVTQAHKSFFQAMGRGCCRAQAAGAWI